MAIVRDNAVVPVPLFTVGLNIVLEGSKGMTPEQQEAAIEVEEVRVVVASVGDPSLVLVDVVLPAKEFHTGSVGYGLQAKGLRFVGV